jgi:hypothetical protein
LWPSGHQRRAPRPRSLQPSGRGPPRDFIEKEPTRLEIELGFARNARCYQSASAPRSGRKAELLTWREATYYSRDREGRAFDIASSRTRRTPTGRPSGCQQGLRAQFDLSAPSPNGFRPLRATLDFGAEDGVWALVIHISARVTGNDLFGQVTLDAGVGPTTDVRFYRPYGHWKSKGWPRPDDRHPDRRTLEPGRLFPVERYAQRGLLLRGFGKPGAEQLYAFDKRQEKDFPVPIENIAAARSFSDFMIYNTVVQYARLGQALAKSFRQ